MSGIQVIVHRDSVCMGDDVNAPNETRFWLADSGTVSEIFRELAASGYLPSISGSNEYWEALVNGSRVCTFGKNIERPDFFVPENQPVSKTGAFEGTAKVRLKYFSAPN